MHYFLTKIMDSLTLTQDLSEAGQNTTHGEAFSNQIEQVSIKHAATVKNTKEYEMKIK